MANVASLGGFQTFHLPTGNGARGDLQMDWDDFKYFTAVANTGSVRAAAQQLSVHASTVTRRIDQFEQRLGVHLFNRSPRGLTITPEGAEVIQRVDKVADELGDIETQLRGRDERLVGHVRLTLPDVLAQSVLLAELGRFNDDYPGIEIELLVDEQGLDMVRREADIAISPTNNPPDSLIGRPMTRFAVAAYGSNRYIAEHELDVDASSAKWIEAGTPGPVADFARGLREDRYPGSKVYLRCDSAMMQHAAVRAKLGLAILPCVLGDQDSDLTRLRQIEPTPGPMIWLLTHPDLRSAQRVHVLIEFIRGVFSDNNDLLMGVAKV